MSISSLAVHSIHLSSKYSLSSLLFDGGRERRGVRFISEAVFYLPRSLP